MILLYSLFNGDCLEVMDSLISDGVKVDLVLTDPPYGVTKCKWDSVIPFDEMWSRLNELGNLTTPFVLFGSEPFSSNLRMSNIKNYKYDWIWDKISHTSFMLAKKQPLNNIECVSVFYRKQCKYNPQMWKVSSDKIDKRKTFNESNCKDLWNSSITRKRRPDTGLRYPLRIVKYNSQGNECNNSNRVHPTQKPVKLLEHFIKTYTDEGDTVLDFTMGSGSTGVACGNLNRKFIGIELDKEYYKIAENRIREAYSQERLQ